jgi:hypothetical protein
MPKRTLAVIAAAAFGALALPFGLPTIAHATGPTYNGILISPLPIEQPGALNPANPSTNTVTLCVQPQENGVKVAVGATVFLSIDSGLFTAPPAAGGGAVVGSTPLTLAPQSFTTVANCTFANPGGNDGSLTDALQITYTGPNPVPVNGRDVISAASAAADITSGLCNGTPVCDSATYVFSPVTQYIFSTGATIATTGSLAAAQQVPFTVTAEDATSHAVPGSFIDLSLSSSSGTGGTATAVNIRNGNTKIKPVTNLPTTFGADVNGMVSVTYTAANPLPSTGAVDTVTAQNHPTETVENSATYTYTGSNPPPVPGPYTAITPYRVCDTRPAVGGVPVNQCNSGSTGAGSGPILQNTSRVITVRNFGSPVVPTDATAVVINATAIAPTKPTYVTLYPDLQTLPGTSNLNVQAGEVVANLVEVQVSSGGKIDVYNAAGTINVALDIEGFVSPSLSTGKYNTLAAPARICDTRAAGGGIPATQCNTAGHSPILGTGPVLTFNVHTLTDGVPSSGVAAVVFNLTAIAPSVRTVLTAWPAGVTEPLASNINLEKGTAVPNRVIVAVSGSGNVSIANGIGSVDVAVDIDGWFASTGAQFSALTPARICNTQNGNASDAGCAKAFVGAGSVLNIDIAGIDGVPVESAGSPVAVVLNVTAVNATTGTFVSVYPGPGTATRPNASDINVSSYFPVPNLVVVGVGSDGTINLYNAVGNVNLIVDVYGYYS